MLYWIFAFYQCFFALSFSFLTISILKALQKNPSAHQKAVPVHTSEVLPDNPHFLYKILCFSTAIFAIL